MLLLAFLVFLKILFRLIISKKILEHQKQTIRNTKSICLTVYSYVQNLLYIDINMVTEFQLLRNLPTNAKSKIDGIHFIEKPQQN